MAFICHACYCQCFHTCSTYSQCTSLCISKYQKINMKQYETRRNIAFCILWECAVMIRCISCSGSSCRSSSNNASGSSDSRHRHHSSCCFSSNSKCNINLTNCFSSSHGRGIGSNTYYYSITKSNKHGLLKMNN